MFQCSNSGLHKQYTTSFCGVTAQIVSTVGLVPGVFIVTSFGIGFRQCHDLHCILLRSVAVCCKLDNSKTCGTWHSVSQGASGFGVKASEE